MIEGIRPYALYHGGRDVYLRPDGAGRGRSSGDVAAVRDLTSRRGVGSLLHCRRPAASAQFAQCLLELCTAGRMIKRIKNESPSFDHLAMHSSMTRLASKTL